jgi:hypothetical protein
MERIENIYIFIHRNAFKIDTEKNEIILENLRPGLKYELVIKAGNSNGTSQLSPPLQFVTADNFFIEAQTGKIILFF